jgi:putative ABC transport system ATP-binding protein
LTTLLACRHVDFHYPRDSKSEAEPLLQDVEAVFPGGQIMLVSGRSGVGKSTLLYLLAGLLRPTGGEIQADGQRVSRWLTAHRDRWRRHVGIVFQQDHLVDRMTALENVILPLIPRKGGLRQWRQHGLAMLDRLDLGGLAGHLAGELSGGQRQRVSVARALVGVPDYIVADEPIAHQDLQNAQRIGTLLRRAADRGAVVVVAAHDRHVDEWLAVDRHLHLDNGKLQSVS